MKEFRKIENGLFVCEECGLLCGDKKYLSKHVRKTHNIKKYYDKWLKEEREGKCKICGEETKFIGFARKNGYEPYCSKVCINKGRYIGTSLGNKKLYGVENPFQREEIKQKIKQKNLKNLGVEYPAQSEICKDKQRKTFLRKYGVEHNMQNKEIFEKQQLSGFNIKKYKNVYYRGSYELDFLEKYYDKFLDIQNAPAIKYKFNKKNKTYYPDFYIPSLNLIIECKNLWLMKKDRKQIQAKEKATIANGFKYIMILNKNYDILNNFLKSA